MSNQDAIDWRTPIQPAEITWYGDIPISRQFDEGYFSDTDPILEASVTYIQANRLGERFRSNQQVTIAELGFGFGLNFLLTAQLWQRTAPERSWLDYIAFELHPVTIIDLQKAYSHWPQLSVLGEELLASLPLPVPGYHLVSFEALRIRCLLVYGDARHYLPQLQAQIDCWFLDAFSPKRNFELWQPEIFSQISRLSHRHSTLSTYSVARTVKDGITAAGFHYRLLSATGRKRQRLVADGTEALAPKRKDSVKQSTAIIGSGVAGLCLARELQFRGYEVTLFDTAKTVGSGASGAPVAVVRPWLSKDLNLDAQWSLLCYLTALKYWSRSSRGSDRLLGQPLILRKKEGQDFRELLHNFPALRYLASLVREAITTQQMNLKTDQEDLCFPFGGWIHPRRLAHELFTELEEKCTFHFDHQLTQLIAVDSHWACQFKQKNERIFDQVIIANATGISQLKQTVQIPVQSIAGQINQISALPKENLQNGICQPGFLLPGNTNSWHLGATFEPDTLSVSQATEQLNTQFRKLFPDCDHSVIFEMQSYWRNARACTLDHLPLVGAAPNYYENTNISSGRGTKSTLADLTVHPNLYLFSGFGSRGFTTIPASANFLASLIDHTVSPWPKRLSERVNPGRFLLRQQQKR
ncbi:MAG TPA: hypothetical protein DCZ03_10320 [Gammaproteobacteria bacterium]|nr:hypothetical protein [Gammaproteobacteria bacterium]